MPIPNDHWYTTYLLKTRGLTLHKILYHKLIIDPFHTKTET